MTPSERAARKRQALEVLRRLRAEAPKWTGTLATLLTHGTRDNPTLFLTLLAGAGVALTAKGRGDLIFQEASALGTEVLRGLIDDIIAVVERE